MNGTPPPYVDGTRYVMRNELTEDYVFSLLDRIHYTNVSDDPRFQDQADYTMRDIEGIYHQYYDLDSLRNDAVNRWVQMSNG